MKEHGNAQCFKCYWRKVCKGFMKQVRERYAIA